MDQHWREADRERERENYFYPEQRRASVGFLQKDELEVEICRIYRELVKMRKK